MSLFPHINLAEVGPACQAVAVDGWMLFDFKGVNPVVRRVLGTGGGLATRRLFVWLPVTGEPVALVHRIEQHSMEGFPGDIRVYGGWEELHERLRELVDGKRIAMEVSPDDAVPYLDRVPAGVVELIRHLGGRVFTSAPLVSQFAARWSSQEMTDHREAAEIICSIARRTLRKVLSQDGRVRETAVQRAVLRQMDRSGLVTDHPPIVAFGANSANPHYEPQEGADAVLEEGDVILLDLWAGKSDLTVFADQTWMAFKGDAPPREVVEVWTITRNARDAVLERLREAAGAGEVLTGADLDDVARSRIRNAGYGNAFTHRTGHSIDTDLHGSGPHLDNFESHDTRELITGIGFSVEPGIYLTGRFGVRSEVNVIMLEEGPEVTPAIVQQDLMTRG